MQVVLQNKQTEEILCQVENITTVHKEINKVIEQRLFVPISMT